MLRFTSLSFASHAFKVTHGTVNEAGAFWGPSCSLVVYFSLGQSLNLPACPHVLYLAPPGIFLSIFWLVFHE